MVERDHGTWEAESPLQFSPHNNSNPLSFFTGTNTAITALISSELIVELIVVAPSLISIISDHA